MNTFPILAAASSGLIVVATAVLTVAISRYRRAGIEMGAWEQSEPLLVTVLIP